MLDLQKEQEAWGRAVTLREGALGTRRSQSGREWGVPPAAPHSTPSLAVCSPPRPHLPEPSEGLARVPISTNYLWAGQPNG